MGGLSSLAKGLKKAWKSANWGLFGAPSSPGEEQRRADPYHRLRGKYMNELSSYTGSSRPELQYGRDAVLTALGRTQKGFTFNDEDPSYQFRLQQGQEAVARQMGRQGHNASGNLWQGITDYAQDAASQEYGAQYDRWLQRNAALSQLGGQTMDIDQQRMENLMRLAQVDQASAVAGAEARAAKRKENTLLS